MSARLGNADGFPEPSVGGLVIRDSCIGVENCVGGERLGRHDEGSPDDNVDGVNVAVVVEGDESVASSADMVTYGFVLVETYQYGTTACCQSKAAPSTILSYAFLVHREIEALSKYSLEPRNNFSFRSREIHMLFLGFVSTPAMRHF